MQKKILILDGNNCQDEASFYNEFYRNLTDIEMLIKQGYLDKDGKFNGNGFNLDTCDDILYGGFGVIETDNSGEPENVTIIFKNFESAKKDLSFEYEKNQKFIDLVLEIFNEHSSHIELKLE